MPFRSVKPKPIRIAVQPRHLADSHTARILVVDRTRTRECASCAIGARSKRIRLTVLCEFEESTDRLNASWLCFCESAARDRRVLRLTARREHPGIPSSHVPEVP